MTFQKSSSVDLFGLSVVRYEDRPDAGRWRDPPVYRCKAVFTTRNGSWDLSSDPGAIEQPFKDQFQSGKLINGSGGDHNLFVICYDEQGRAMVGKGIMFWQGPMNPTFQVSDLKTTVPDGSENLPVFGVYYPDQGQHGSWSACTVGRSDVIVGVGMPWNWHVSTFLVLQAESGVTPPVPSVEQDVILKAIAEHDTNEEVRYADLALRVEALRRRTFWDMLRGK